MIGGVLKDIVIGSDKPQDVTATVLDGDAQREIKDAPTYLKGGSARVRLDDSGKVQSAIIVTAGLAVQEQVYADLVAELGEPSSLSHEPIALPAIVITALKRRRGVVRSIVASWALPEGGEIVFHGGDFSAGLIVRT